MSFRSIATDSTKVNSWSLQRSKMSHLLQSIALNLLIIALTTSVCCVVFGPAGLLLALALLPIGYISAQSYSSDMVLQLYHAVPVEQEEAYGLRVASEDLRLRAGIPQVSLYYCPQASLNAFSTGNFHGARIVLSHGLLIALSEAELVAVLAHEIAHIKNGDLTINVTMQLFGKVLSMLCFISLLYLLVHLPAILNGTAEVSLAFAALVGLSPHLAHLVQLKLSRLREYEADRVAVALTQAPEQLISTIVKIEELSHTPLAGLSTPIPEWLNTHPSFANRIKHIRSFMHS